MKKFWFSNFCRGSVSDNVNSSPPLWLFLAKPFLSSSTSIYWTRGKIICKGKKHFFPRGRKKKKLQSPCLDLQRKNGFSLEEVPPELMFSYPKSPNKLNSDKFIAKKYLLLKETGSLISWSLSYIELLLLGWFLASTTCINGLHFYLFTFTSAIAYLILVYLHIHQTR